VTLDSLDHLAFAKSLFFHWTTKLILFVHFLAVRFSEKPTNDELKNIAQIEHSRHRSFPNFIVNLIGGIAAYCLFPKKPMINLERVYSNQLTLF